ncbi:diguanylate cyclase [Guyparkeria halopsychrophila]|uniref:sensor domain-containing diguanylate cyclase n=1 Tax=Guyparkeria halopsychrophila TaxID=3139421 RepID=UPI0037C7D071
MADGNRPDVARDDPARQLQIYRAMFEQCCDAIVLQDHAGFLSCNPDTLLLFRVPDTATFATLQPADLSPPNQADGRPSSEAAAARLEEAMSQGTACFEWCSRTWDGVDFSVEVSLSRVDLEEGPLVQAVVRDISDRKEGEAALRSREQELAEAQRIAHLGSWISDFRTDEIRWSDEVYRILGLNREEWGASHELFMAAVHPSDREKVQAALETSFQGERYELDHRIICPDGEVRTVHERGYTELNADGKPQRLFGTMQDITEQRRLEDSLRRLAAILDSTPDIVAMHDGDGTMLYLNATGRRFAGLPERSSQDLWQPKTGWDRSDLPPETESLEGALRWAHPPWVAEKILNEGLPIAWEEGSWRGETVALDGEGKEVPVSQVLIVHRDDAGEMDQVSTILGDISARRDLEDQLRRETALSESILASLPGIFYVLDGQGHLIQWNDRMEAVTGLSYEELDGLDALALVPPEERRRVAKAIAKTFSEGSAVVESKLLTVEGDAPYLFNGLRVELNGQFSLLGVGLDIAKQKKLERSLEREATTDSLTGISNRQRFDTEMEHALARHARYGTQTALAMIDLDHFKPVNDTYGHDVGDQTLVDLTKRLAEEIREPDFLARWGGEEFVVLLPETGPSEAFRMAERLRRRIEVEPFPGVGALTISLGITNFQSGDTPNTLLKRVDTALYEAKRAGRNRVVVNGEDSGA